MTDTDPSLARYISSNEECTDACENDLGTVLCFCSLSTEEEEDVLSESSHCLPSELNRYISNEDNLTKGCSKGRETLADTVGLHMLTASCPHAWGRGVLPGPFGCVGHLNRHPGSQSTR